VAFPPISGAWVRLLRLRPLHRALCGLAAGFVLAPTSPLAQTPAATNPQWSCTTGATGAWVCTERSSPGRTYERPVRRATAKATGKPVPVAADTVAAANNLDWLALENLSPEQRKTARPGCCGTYVEPKNTAPDAALSPADAPLRATADSTDAQGETATLTGDVQITKGRRQVRSDRATLDRSTNLVVLEDHIQFREPGMLLLGDRAQMNTKTQAIALDNATFAFHEKKARGTASHFRRDEEGVLYIDNATYTTCEPASNSWRLRTARVRVDADGHFATARHARVEVRNVPILYAPWIRFPIDDNRATGLLFPQLAIGDQNGIDFAQPIYLNLAPNYDATITPRYLQERGEMIEGEFRHLSLFDSTSVSGAFLPSDNGDSSRNLQDTDPAAQTNPTQGKDRWLGNLTHTGGMGYAWHTRADYTKISDIDYFRDIGTSTLAANSQVHLLQQVAAGYQFPNWWLNVADVEYQTIAPDLARQYKQLPRVDLNGDYRFDNDLLMNLGNQYTVFDHDDSRMVTGNRLRTNYSLAWDKRWAWGHFRPAAKLKHLDYTLDNPTLPGGSDNPNVTVPVFDFDSGLYFERHTNLFKGFTQTLEPRLYYLNSKFENQTDNPDFDTSELTFSYQQLFRDDRFSGSDRIGDANQVTVGATSRLIDDRGIEVLRGSLGQIQYLRDRYVSLNPTFTKSFLDNLSNPQQLTDITQRDVARQLRSNDSPYAGEFFARLSNHWRLQSDALYDDREGRFDKGNVSMRYAHNDALINLSYRFTRKTPRLINGRSVQTDIDQSDFSTYYPIAPQWTLIGRWNHDLTNSRELEVLGGFEYDSCCWKLSLLARRWLNRDDTLLIPEENLSYNQGIFLQIQLIGLAGTGKQVDNILKDSIYGYEPITR
jgi:LPS-assembly protein